MADETGSEPPNDDLPSEGAPRGDVPGEGAPPEDVQEIGAPELFAALAHPLRHRLLFALGHRPATISQLAVRLDVRKGSVGHHLKVLREAGLVRVARTRQVRGGTEQYYQRTARRMLIAEPRAAGTAAMLGAVAQELDRSPDDSALTLRHLRLDPDRARELAETLRRLVDEAEEAAERGESGEEHPVYGLLVAVYRQAAAGEAGE
jgi:DNA-binding transcriptional ArsR family regulator